MTCLTKSRDARRVYEKAAIQTENATLSPRRGGNNVFSQISLS
jgi:hypothetical protein